jgi:LPS-assembly lipoprotein
VIRRDISFSDALVLSKEAEEVLLWRDIQNDLVQQLLRRLAAAKPATIDKAH